VQKGISVLLCEELADPYNTASRSPSQAKCQNLSRQRDKHHPLQSFSGATHDRSAMVNHAFWIL
jgi:hypothetical protein